MQKVFQARELRIPNEVVRQQNQNVRNMGYTTHFVKGCWFCSTDLSKYGMLIEEAILYQPNYFNKISVKNITAGCLVQSKHFVRNLGQGEV